MPLKTKDIRAMNAEDRAKALTENRAELMHQRGLAAMGGAVKNPGQIRDLRTSIARILTIEHEEHDADLGSRPAPRAPGARPATKPAAKAPAKSVAAKSPAKPAKPAAKAAPAKAAAKAPVKKPAKKTGGKE